MKTSIAIIKLVLRTNKTLADGTHPIMLRCSFNGMKEVATGFRCSEKSWDKNRMMVKSSFPNFKAINAAISKRYAKAIEKRDFYELNGLPYTPSMVLSEEDVEIKKKTSLEALIEDYCKEHSLKTRTVYEWNGVFHLIQEFSGKKDIEIFEITSGFLAKFITWLKDIKKLKDSSLRSPASKVVAISRYAHQKGIIEKPIVSTYSRKFKVKNRINYIHIKTMNVLLDMFFDEFIIVNGRTWHYRDNALESLMDKHSPIFAEAFFVMSYMLQGLAPVDLCLLKKADIEIKHIGDDVYYSIDTNRTKTNVGVKIRVKKTIRSMALIQGFLMANGGEWLLPLLNGIKGDSEGIIKSRVGNSLTFMRKDLKAFFMRVNQHVIQMNVDNHTHIPLIGDDCNYYSARHSYAMAYMQKGGNPLSLATLLGRSVNTLAAYVSELTEEDDLTSAVGIMDI